MFIWIGVIPSIFVESQHRQKYNIQFQLSVKIIIKSSIKWDRTIKWDKHFINKVEIGKKRVSHSMGWIILDYKKYKKQQEQI
jgi:hypothetical protein